MAFINVSSEQDNRQMGNLLLTTSQRLPYSILFVNSVFCALQSANDKIVYNCNNRANDKALP
jgi:hypothetical protein